MRHLARLTLGLHASGVQSPWPKVDIYSFLWELSFIPDVRPRTCPLIFIIICGKTRGI